MKVAAGDDWLPRTPVTCLDAVVVSFDVSSVVVKVVAGKDFVPESVGGSVLVVEVGFVEGFVSVLDVLGDEDPDSESVVLALVKVVGSI